MLHIREKTSRDLINVIYFNKPLLACTVPNKDIGMQDILEIRVYRRGFEQVQLHAASVEKK